MFSFKEMQFLLISAIKLFNGLSTTKSLMEFWKHTLKIKKICFSPKVSIQLWGPKSDSALPGAIWAQFRSKKLNQKAIPAHAMAHFSHWDQICPK